MKRAIVNLSTKKFYKGQDRLIETLKGNTDADLLMFRREREVGAPLHSKNKYAFKTYAIQEAIRQGYTSIIWLDASMYVVKDLTPLFEEIEKTGYFFQDSEWMNKQWTTPEQKEYFGTDEGKMISAGFVGFNINRPTGLSLFQLWHKASIQGLFNGSHENSRHDQSCLSLIIEICKLKITPNDTYWQYGNPNEPTKHENILAIAHGIC